MAKIKDDRLWETAHGKAYETLGQITEQIFTTTHRFWRVWNKSEMENAKKLDDRNLEEVWSFTSRDGRNSETGEMRLYNRHHEVLSVLTYENIPIAIEMRFIPDDTIKWHALGIHRGYVCTVSLPPQLAELLENRLVEKK